jgi:RNA polymerase sigma-70 factor (ECF subfamily)
VVDDEEPGNVEESDEMRATYLRPVPPALPGSSEVAAPDSLLVAQARDGGSEAFAEIVRRRSPGLLAFLRRLLGDTEDARDVAQLTFVRAWENLDRYDASWAFSTWLFRIASNLAVDALRSRSSRSRTEVESFRLVRGGLAAEPEGPAGLERKEIRRIFEECAEVLSEKQRLVFVLHELEERESREIAALLDCRESTVRNHLFQARRLLREEIRQRYPEFVRGAGGEKGGPR